MIPSRLFIMSNKDQKLQEDLASYLLDIQETVQKTSFEAFKSKTNVDAVDKLDIEAIEDAFKSKDTVAHKTAVFEFFQKSFNRGRTLKGIGNLLGWNLVVVKRYYNDYIDWLHGVTGSTSLSLKIFDRAANDYQLAAAKLNRLVEILYNKAEKAISEGKNHELCASYVTSAIKACTELANVQTKFQEICIRMGVHDRLKDHFYQVSNEDEFTMGKTIAANIENKMRKDGISELDLEEVRGLVNTARAKRNEKEINTGFEFLNNEV